MTEKRIQGESPQTQLDQTTGELTLTRETEHFTLHYSELDQTCIDTVVDVLEDNYKEVTNKLQQQLRKKLTVEIHSDRQQMRLALGFPDAPDWIRGGLGVGQKIVIASPLNPPPGSKFANVVNTAVHEFIHILLKKINPVLPRWLDEGVASYEAKDNSEMWIINTVRKGLETNTLPSFADLDTGDDFQRFFQRDGYQYSYTIVESIIHQYGYDKLRRFLQSPDQYVQIFGITEKELENSWIDYIKNNYL